MYIRLIITTFSVLCASTKIIELGPRFPPTKGEVWPKPQFQKKENTSFLFLPSQFNFTITNHNCVLLKRAIMRYSQTLTNHAYIARWSKEISSKKNNKTADQRAGPYIKELEIDLNMTCEEYPYIWGWMRAEARVNSTKISDYPRYQHRGLLLDTSRHFISMSNILKILNGMSMNKLNVFHWHIVDDESFPYQSERFPDLSVKGAFFPSKIYSKADIQIVIQYATDRGIRVIPEFDVPGHTRSWGETFPNILTECYKGNKVVGLGPMDPTNNDTYTVLKDLFNEVQAIFPDEYFHVGGNEVNLKCWSSNPGVKEYIKKHNLTEEKLHGIFMENVLSLLKDKTKVIVWQDIYDEGVPLNKDVLVQVFKTDHCWEEMANVLNSGYKVLYSSSWQLDYFHDESKPGDWQKDFYLDDPRDMLNGMIDNSLLSNIVGGEACLWGDVVDNSNIITRVWPRASAVAERLWSPSIPTSESTRKAEVPDEVVHRLEEHYCRMKRRGVDAQPPNGPGVCVTNNPRKTSVYTE